jgi:CHRD domain/S-layer homology domain
LFRSVIRGALGAVLALGALAGLAPAPAAAAPSFFEAGMAGRFVVPGPGDPNAQGIARLEVIPESGEICMHVWVTGVTTPTAMHLHAGEEGESGPLVATLLKPIIGAEVFDCIEGLDSSLLEAVVANPSNYYVDVHTTEYPDGAVRRQLSTEPQGLPGCDPGHFCDGPLQPATYTHTGFESVLTFTTTTPWVALKKVYGGFALFHPDDLGEIVGLQYTGAYTDPCDLESIDMADLRAQDLADWLVNRPYLVADSARAVSYGGVDGFAVDIYDSTGPCDAGFAMIFGQGGGEFGDWRMVPGEAARVVMLDVGSETIIFIADAYNGAWSDIVDAGQAIFESFAWTIAPFGDIAGSTFADHIVWAFERGITTGCSSAPPLFCPNDTVTRGQMAAFLDRALDLPNATQDYFTDDTGSTFEDSINRVREAGIAFGCTTTTYCPTAPVLREQMASFLDRAFDPANTANDFFTDDETSTHENAINRIAEAGITSGCTATTFCPKNPVTRGQMTAFLHRAMGD